MNIVLIGRGGHSKVVEDIIIIKKEHVVVAYLDERYEELKKINEKYYGPIHQSIEQLKGIFHELLFVITIGSNHVRKRLADSLPLLNHEYATLIHPKAVVSPGARIGVGTVVMASAVINADTKVGNHVIINTSSVVEHDNVIDDFVHISPGAVLAGTVSIGEGSHIGSGAVIIPNKHVGSWSVLGAGATAIKNIPAYSTAVGVPAKVIQKEILEV